MKMTVVQLVQIFPAFYGVQMFVSVFTDHHTLES